MNAAPRQVSLAVLVTGATGLVGHELVDRLRQGGSEVVGVARRATSDDPDMVVWDMGNEHPPERLLRPWDAIVNAAANTRWTMSPREATEANVASLRALRPLVSDATHLVHVSTAYAQGRRGSVESADLGDYRNSYEWSKAHAERLAREIFPSVTIVRPPLVLGRRADGRAARFSGLYTLMRGSVMGTVPAVVADPQARFDAIPVDDLARLLVKLTERGCEQTTLTIAGGRSAPTVAEAIAAMFNGLNEWRQARQRPPLETLPLVSPDSWNRFFWPFLQDHLTPRQLTILGLLRSFEPYLALKDSLQPDYEVTDVLSCIESSTRYWAEANPRLAARSPRPWRPTPRADETIGEPIHA